MRQPISRQNSQSGSAALCWCRISQLRLVIFPVWGRDKVFVKATDGKCSSLGIGKLIDRKDENCLVEYFNYPNGEPVREIIDSELVEGVTIPKQTRIYYFNEAIGVWEIGRLIADHGDALQVQFSEGESRRLGAETVYVRWDLPVEDPTPFLASWINESFALSDDRRSFVNSQVRQRAASMGISALLSCAINLEAHQIEVVRRVLQDPVQRYLLADEVGLGKTVEAGVLIRQCVLDAEKNCTILVLVPANLIDQWRSELIEKFFLWRCLNGENPIINLLAFDAEDDHKKIQDLLPKTTMLVIDEAHRLTSLAVGGRSGIYAHIARVSSKIERVLLLSATPALRNERGFLEMLHLLDPSAYPLDGEDQFRLKVENRQSLSEIVAGLVPENVFYLDYTLDQLDSIFTNDEILRERVSELRSIIEGMPDENDQKLIESISKTRAHLSEVYRLHRRILRHRRRSIRGLTPERSGAHIVRYRSAERAALTEAIDDWRFNEAVSLDAMKRDDLWKTRAQAFSMVLDRASQYPSSGPGTIGFIAQKADLIGNPSKFDPIKRCMGQPGLSEDRVCAMIDALKSNLGSGADFVVFCSDSKTAEYITKRIEDNVRLNVYLYKKIKKFSDLIGENGNQRIIVCDRTSEEGLNLQGRDTIVVHYDLPFNPNRIEQRIGRVDRYGSVNSVRSIVLVCEDDPIEGAWLQYLDNSLRIFNRSIASLQYLIDETVKNLASLIFTDGTSALTELVEHSSGDDGAIASEFRSLDAQDALDALGAPPTDVVEDLVKIDRDWEDLEGEETPWIEKGFCLERRAESVSVGLFDNEQSFYYFYSQSGIQTIIPRSVFWINCKGALDLKWDKSGSTTIQTIPYSYSRKKVLSRGHGESGMYLLRYGDPLINGLAKITEQGEYARSFAVWRFIDNNFYETDVPVADICFRFDFVIEADVAEAIALLNEYCRDKPGAVAAIKRRGDMALRPMCYTLWLDRQLNRVTDINLIKKLERPYVDDWDFDLCHTGRLKLEGLGVPELDHWADICRKSRYAAESALRTDSEFSQYIADAERRAMEVDHGRLGQLLARVRSSGNANEEIELAFEERLAEALRNGIRTPKVRVDIVGAVFTSADRSATDRVMGRC